MIVFPAGKYRVAVPFNAVCIVLFRQWLLAGGVVGDPFAVAQSVLEAPLGGQRAIRAMHFPTAVGFAVDVGRLAVDLPIVEVVGPLALLPALLKKYLVELPTVSIDGT